MQRAVRESEGIARTVKWRVGVTIVDGDIRLRERRERREGKRALYRKRPVLERAPVSRRCPGRLHLSAHAPETGSGWRDFWVH